MKFSDVVPQIAERMRPWARSLSIGPPRNEQERIGSLMCQVDEQTEFGRTFRFYLDMEDGDVQRLLRGGVIEVSVISSQMVPVSVQLLGGEGVSSSAETHDHDTLTKVSEALRGCEMSDQQITDAISAMQNKGILFRERA